MKTLAYYNNRMNDEEIKVWKKQWEIAKRIAEIKESGESSICETEQILDDVLKKTVYATVALISVLALIGYMI